MSDNKTIATGNATGYPTGTTFATHQIDRGSGTADETIVETGFRDASGTANGFLDGSNVLTLLASAARASAAAQNSPAQNTPNARGLLLFLDVTVEAGSAKTLSVKVQAKDPVSGNWVTAYDFGVLVTHATGTFTALVYPGITTGDFGGTVAKNGSVPRDWRAAVTASDGTSWTYSLGAAVLH